MKTRPLFWRIIFTVLVFTLIVVAGSLYTGYLLRSHMRKEAENVLAKIILRTESDLVEAETVLDIISLTVRSMVLRGDSADMILNYMKDISAELRGKQGGFTFDSLYGYFDVFGGAFLHSKGWFGGESYNPTERPWYRFAVTAGDKIDVTPLYWNLELKAFCVTYVRRLFNEAGQPLGIVCLDVPVNKIINDTSEMKLTKGSYGVLHDAYLNIYYHPNTSVIGKNGRDVGGGVAEMGNRVRAGETFSEYESTNLSGVITYTFSSQSKNGWVLYFIIPKTEYLQEIRNMTLLFSIFGFVMAAVLVIVNIFADKSTRKKVTGNKE
jgi:hypothetical protein